MKRQLPKAKTLVVWVDGGTYNVIMPMLRKGRLPTFRKMMKDGVSGTLISTTPPATAPAWASLVTGVNPGKHGVYDFWEKTGNDWVPATSWSVRRETLWSMLEEAGRKSILLNTPLTYPPRKINGILVTGLMTPANAPYTYPGAFKDELLKEFPEYSIIPEASPVSCTSVNEHLSFLEEAYNLMRTRRDVTLYLMENYDWDLFVSVFYCTDQIQHYYWRYMDPMHPLHDPDAPKKLKEAIYTSYEIVDDSVKKILKTIDDDTTLVLMSDHGAGPIYKYVFLNYYLMKLGLLLMNKKASMQSVIGRLLKTLELRLPRVSKFVPGTRATVFDKIRPRIDSIARVGEHFKRTLNWEKTKALSFGSLGWGMFVNQHTIKSTREYERLIEYLIRKLFELRDPYSGEKIAEEILRKTQIYSGPYVERAPDITLIPKKSYLIRGWLATDQIVGPSSDPSGHHQMEGILIMYGKNLKEGHGLKNCNITDLAPTILYSMGFPILSDMDGRVLTDAFHASYIKAHPVRMMEKRREPVARERYIFSEKEKRIVKERLKDLGYL